jgi:hypothetical protein
MTDEEKSALMDQLLERVFQLMPRMLLLYMDQREALSGALGELFARRPELLERQLEVMILFNQLRGEDLPLGEITARIEEHFNG